MKHLVTLVIIFSLVACSTNSIKPGEPVEFDIHWREGKPTLRSTHLREDFQKRTHFGPYAPEIALMLVPSEGTEKESQQWREVFEADPESRTFIVVMADLTGLRKDYYSVDVSTAERLYEGRSNEFHILLLDNSGRLILESDEVVPADVIQEHFPIDTEYKGPVD
ncbi:hypothetical protein [Saccharospirillum salsuginis]|uniref:Uncharacterized protein n=1 Tax=Saccharospirillum salsuginis TaxID=418750 RepID=A0A918K587_9GAMM|nr:hypothetical protein [Saccharospirillum salsuginis]GGX48729.1 hypothetical protein GCM10007392_14810 [Saccharospirillum salsuginis]